MDQELDTPTALVRLRKIDGSYAGCAYGEQSFEPDADGTVMVSSDAAGVLTESHGFEVVPQDVVDATEPVEVFAGVPEEEVEEVRAEVESEGTEQTASPDEAAPSIQAAPPDETEGSHRPRRPRR